jgi:hypothetical protein
MLNQAIGLTFPRQRYSVGQADARLANGKVSPSAALAVAFGDVRELADARLASRPIRLFGDLVGGALELRSMPTPIRIGDVIETAGRIADATVLPEGERFVVDTASFNQRGEMVCEARYTFVLPAASSSGRPPSVPPVDEEDPRIAGRRTVMGKFEFVRIVRGQPSRGLPPEIDPFRTGVDEMLEVLGGDPTKLRRIRGNIVAAAPEGADLVVHGRRDKKRTSVILFEVVTPGMILVADGVAEISQ